MREILLDGLGQDLLSQGGRVLVAAGGRGVRDRGTCAGSAFGKGRKGMGKGGAAAPAEATLAPVG